MLTQISPTITQQIYFCYIVVLDNFLRRSCKFIVLVLSTRLQVIYKNNVLYKNSMISVEYPLGPFQ
jgi:hypothetical protein